MLAMMRTSQRVLGGMAPLELELVLIKLKIECVEIYSALTFVLNSVLNSALNSALAPG